MNYTTKQDLNTTQFWMVDEAYLRSGYKKGHLNASGYVYGILKVSRKDGWWFSLNISEFCLKYEIPRTSLYRALKKLQKDPDINLEWSTTQVKIRIPTRDNHVPNLERPNLENDVPNSVNGVPNLEHSKPNSVIDVPNLVNLTAESLVQQEVEESYISSTDNLRYTDSSHTSTDNAQAAASPLPHPSGGEVEQLELAQEEECHEVQEEEEDCFENDLEDEPDYFNDEGFTSDIKEAGFYVVFFSEYLSNMDMDNCLDYEFPETQVTIKKKIEEYASSGIVDYIRTWVASFCCNDMIGVVAQQYVSRFTTVAELLEDRAGLLILCDCVLKWEKEELYLKPTSQQHCA